NPPSGSYRVLSSSISPSLVTRKPKHGARPDEYVTFALGSGVPFTATPDHANSPYGANEARHRPGSRSDTSRYMLGGIIAVARHVDGSIRSGSIATSPPFQFKTTLGRRSFAGSPQVSVGHGIVAGTT